MMFYITIILMSAVLWHLKEGKSEFVGKSNIKRNPCHNGKIQNNPHGLASVPFSLPSSLSADPYLTAVP